MTEQVLRKIIHVDMDAFYASVEQRDDPALRGRPVAVGGSRARGVVAAASYEARAFGVRSAMPSSSAARACPDLIEPLSLDEAYLDVSEDRHRLGSARAIAEAIRARIRADTGLTASAGVSYNKFIAKLASDQNKPDGLCVIPPRHGPAFVAGLPVKRFHGVGPVTARRMEALGILSGADLAEQSLAFLQQHFGSHAAYLYGAARGQDDRPVRAHRAAKSIGAERTFEQDLSDPAALRDALVVVADAAWTRIDRASALGRTVTLKLRRADFTTITRARSLMRPVADRAEFLGIGHDLLSAQLPVPGGVRLLGLTLSALVDEAAIVPDRQPLLPL